jgi:hypothetical protein
MYVIPTRSTTNAENNKQPQLKQDSPKGSQKATIMPLEHPARSTNGGSPFPSNKLFSGCHASS